LSSFGSFAPLLLATVYRRARWTAVHFSLAAGARRRREPPRVEIGEIPSNLNLPFENRERNRGND
jgi:hypothetical protein